MRFKKRELALFTNSLSLFIISFLCINLILILVKLFIANHYGIETKMQNFTLWGVSHADASAWHKKSVILFHSSELIVLLFLILISIIELLRSMWDKGLKKLISFWFLNTSIILFVGAVVSGIFTKSNVYHFLNWLYIPFSAMLLIALSSILISALLGILSGRLLLKISNIKRPHKTQKYSDLFRLYFNRAFLPFLAGLLLLYLPYLTSIHKYELVEIFVFFVFFSSGSLFIRSRINSSGSDKIFKLSKALLLTASLTYLSFLLFRIL